MSKFCFQQFISGCLKALLHCEMFRTTCLAMFWRHYDGTSSTKHSKSLRHKLQEPLPKVELSSLFVQLVSQRFCSLQGILHCEMFSATCPATMSPKHCETSCTKHFMHSVAAPSDVCQLFLQDWFLLIFRILDATFSLKQQLLDFKIILNNKSKHWV